MSNENARFSPWLSIRSAPVFVQRELGDDGACVFMVKAANEISAAANKIERAVVKAMSNPLGSELANTRAARKAIEQEVEIVLKRVTATTERADAAINMLTEKSNPQMPEDVATALMHQEVRTALQRMTDAERRKAIATAVSSGDETFLAAATSGSPVLSGLTAVEQSVAREQWRRQRHPETSERIYRLRKGVAQLDRIVPMFNKWADQLVKEPAPKVVAAPELSARKAAS